MKKKDRRGFHQVLRGIRGAERDVDRVLEAARLQRCQRPPIDLCEAALAAALVLLVLGAIVIFALLALAR